MTRPLKLTTIHQQRSDISKYSVFDCPDTHIRVDPIRSKSDWHVISPNLQYLLFYM